MKAIILNAHSTLNSGDAAIMLAQLQFLKEKFSPLELAMTSRTPELDAEFYRPLGIKVFPPLFPAPSVFRGAGQKAIQTARHLFAAGNKRSLINEIRTSDLVISCGGGYLWSNRRALPGPMYWQNMLHIWTAKRLKKPVVFFPQSFGPLRSRTAARLLKRALEEDNVIRIFAREKVSLIFLQGLCSREKTLDKLGLCPDMAFYLYDERRLAAPQKDSGWPRPALALTLRRWSFPEAKGRDERRRKHREYLEALAELCRRTTDKGKGSVILFSQARGPGDFEDDRGLTAAFRERLRKDIPEGHLYYPKLPLSVHPFRIMELLQKTDGIVATRLHSAILGMLSGIPALTIAYQPKTRAVMEWLGLSDYSLDIGGLADGKMLTKLGEISGRDREVREKIRDGLATMKPMIETRLETALARFL
jgi:colanic acid/amylovoran biosynthesis protein